MTKRINSKFRVCKKIRGLQRNLWGVQKAAKFRSIKIFKQNIFLAKRKKNRLTAFGRYLNIKQIVKHFYCNLSEQNFQNYINKAIISKAQCVPKLLSLIESRLDTILYRACLVNSLHMGRQLINHQLVFLNQTCISYSGKLVLKSDLICLNSNKKYLSNKLIKVLKTRRLKQYFLISIKAIKNIKQLNLQNKINTLGLYNRFLTNKLKTIFFRKFKTYFKIKKINAIELTPKHLEVNFQIFALIFIWDSKCQDVYYPILFGNEKQGTKNKLLRFNNLLYNV